MSAALITPPAVEPVTLPEARAHLRLDHTDDDDMVGALLTAARAHVEARTRALMIEQGWRVYRDAWPETGVVALPFGPLVRVDAIRVLDAAGTPHALDPAAWRVDAAGRPGRVALAPGVSARPGVALNGIEIDVTVGFGASGIDVPQPLRRAVMMLAARWYENPDGTVVGAMPADIAEGFEALIAPYRIVRL